VAFLAGLGLVSASLQEEFVAYVKEFNKVYTADELFTRFQNFKTTKKSSMNTMPRAWLGKWA